MLADLRYGLRSLLNNPGFAAVAVLTLAIGIGANTAIFSMVNGVLLQPLPYPDAGRVVNVWMATAQEPSGNHSAGEFLDIQRGSQSFSALAGYRQSIFAVAGSSPEPVQLEGTYATVDFFDVLGVAPAAGRLFSRAADPVPAERLAVLSDAAWEQLFDRSPAAVGFRIRVDGEAYTVAGILPQRAEFPEGSRLWLLSDKPVPPSPLSMADPGAERQVHYFNAIGRVRPQLSIQQAQLDLARVAADLRGAQAQTDAGRTVRIAPLHEEMVADVRWGLVLLQSAVGLVLLIACANVSSLLIVRASGRRRELAIRAALGAGRSRLVRQLLTESILLSTLGAAGGLLLGTWLLRALRGMLPEDVPRSSEIVVDWRVAAASLLAALITGIVFAIWPAWQASRADAGGAIKQGGDRGSSGQARGRAALVVSEIALTLVLLTGAGLLLNSFMRLRGVDSGLRIENVTVLDLALPPSRYPDGASQSTLYARLLEALSGRPELDAAGIGFPAPLRGSRASGSFSIDGRATEQSNRPTAFLGSVSGTYFQAMGIPLLTGRSFAESDGEHDPAVAVASAALARKYWPDDSAVGKRLRFEDGPDVPWITIVGVVGDVRAVGLEHSPPPVLYIPYRQFALPFTNVVVRSRAPSAAVTAILRSALTAADPSLAAGEMTTLQGVVDKSLAQPRFRTMLLMAFALAGLMLAAVGVYGLVSYSVASRTREIGIRIALGAQPGQVLLPMMREGLLLAFLGIAIGLGGAAAATRLLASFLFSVRAGDPLTFAGVALLLLVVALAACYIPSRRALRVNPIEALRAE